MCVFRGGRELESDLTTNVMPLAKEKEVLATISRLRAARSVIIEYQQRMEVLRPFKERADELFVAVKEKQAVWREVRERVLAQRSSTCLLWHCSVEAAHACEWVSVYVWSTDDDARDPCSLARV